MKRFFISDSITLLKKHRNKRKIYSLYKSCIKILQNFLQHTFYFNKILKMEKIAMFLKILFYSFLSFKDTWFFFYLFYFFQYLSLFNIQNDFLKRDILSWLNVSDRINRGSIYVIDVKKKILIMHAKKSFSRFKLIISVS